MCFPQGGGSGSDAARQAQAQRENAINAGMGGINSAFAPYNDAYFKNYEGQYVDMARPDIDRQERNARQDVLFGLARQGQTKGSAAAKAYGDIANTRANTDLQVADQARTASSGLRNDVENMRGNLVNQLNATADAGSAAAEARNQAQILTRPPTYSPISNAFSEITNQFAINEQARRAGNPGWGWGFTSVDPIKGSRSSVSNV
jgi:hypothetical protein